MARERIVVKIREKAYLMKLPKTWASWAREVNSREREQIINSAEAVYNQGSSDSRYVIAQAILRQAGRIERG